MKSLYGEHVVRFFLPDGVFLPCDQAGFLTSAYVRIQSINQSIKSNSESMDQPGKVANPARGQLNRENEYFPLPVCA